MDRRQGMLSLLLLLAALSSPMAGAARPLESLRLVFSISWIGDDQAAVEPRPANSSTFRTPAVAAIAYSPIDSHSRLTALPPQFFQRPPPVVVRAL